MRLWNSSSYCCPKLNFHIWGRQDEGRGWRVHIQYPTKKKRGLRTAATKEQPITDVGRDPTTATIVKGYPCFLNSTGMNRRRRNERCNTRNSLSTGMNRRNELWGYLARDSLVYEFGSKFMERVFGVSSRRVFLLLIGAPPFILSFELPHLAPSLSRRFAARVVHGWPILVLSTVNKIALIKLSSTSTID